MLTYWLMFLIPAVASVLAPAAPLPVSMRLAPSWRMLWLVLSLLIGLRHQVGGDWYNYKDHYLDMVGASVLEAAEKMKAA